MWYFLRAFFSIIELERLESILYKNLIKIFSIIFCYFVIYSFLQLSGFIPSNNELFEVTGHFNNPARLFMFVSLLFPSFLYSIRLIKKRLFYLLWFLILTIYLILLIKSGIQIVLITSLLCVFHFIWNEKIFRLKKSILIIISISIVIFIGSYAYLSNSGQGRVLIWKISLQIWREFPIFGAGFESFDEIYTSYQSKYFSVSNNIKEVYIADIVRSPYNEFLKTLCEQGVIGLILLLLPLIVQSILMLKKGMRKEYSGLEFIILPLLSILLYSLVSYPLNEPSIRILSLLFFCIIVTKSQDTVYFNLKTFPLLILLSLFYIVLTLIIIKINKKFSAYREWNQGYNYTLEASDMDRIYPILNNDHNFMNFYFEYLNTEKKFFQSYFLSKGNNNFLKTPQIYYNFYNTYMALNKIEEAESALIFSVNMVPIKLTYRLHLMEHYIKMNELDKAINEAKIIISLPVKTKSNDASIIKFKANDFLNKNSLK